MLLVPNLLLICQRMQKRHRRDGLWTPDLFLYQSQTEQSVLENNPAELRDARGCRRVHSHAHLYQQTWILKGNFCFKSLKNIWCNSINAKRNIDSYHCHHLSMFSSFLNSVLFLLHGTDSSRLLDGKELIKFSIYNGTTVSWCPTLAPTNNLVTAAGLKWNPEICLLDFCATKT